MLSCYAWLSSMWYVHVMVSVLRYAVFVHSVLAVCFETAELSLGGMCAERR